MCAISSLKSSRSLSHLLMSSCFVSVPCARLTWLSRQLLSARKSERSKLILAEVRPAVHITRSHYRAYTINCFAFLNETNACSRTLETKRPDGPAVERRDCPFLPKAGYSERTSVFVCFALRTRTKPDDTELFRTITN